MAKTYTAYPNDATSGQFTENVNAAGGVGGGGGLTNTELRASPVPVKTAAGVTKTDRSGSITAGGTAQQLMAANATRSGWQIWNLSNGDLWVNENGSTAVLNQPSFKLPPGSYYENSSGGVAVTAVSIIGATTGQTFASREW